MYSLNNRPASAY